VIVSSVRARVFAAVSLDSIGVACILAGFALLSDDITFVSLVVLSLLVVAHRWLGVATIGIAAVVLGLLIVAAIVEHASASTLVARGIANRELVIKVMYLAIAGLLIGYLGEKEKARRAGASGGADAALHSARLRRARAHARNHERSRIARELHDGVVQSLSAAELRMDVVRRQVAAASPQQADALLRIQEIFKDDVRHLRLLTRRMDVARAPTLGDGLAGLIDRFRRESGIAVTFICDQSGVALDRAARHEIGRIVQEALVNIRKHSGAHHVVVHASVADGLWVVSVEDNGRGFPFSGRWSRWQLDQEQKGPFVIRQRARALRATLSVESVPGKGARLELGVPLRS
jgi:signal transduction histidine kinase